MPTTPITEPQNLTPVTTQAPGLAMASTVVPAIALCTAPAASYSIPPATASATASATMYDGICSQVSSGQVWLQMGSLSPSAVRPTSLYGSTQQHLSGQTSKQ